MPDLPTVTEMTVWSLVEDELSAATVRGVSQWSGLVDVGLTEGASVGLKKGRCLCDPCCDASASLDLGTITGTYDGNAFSFTYRDFWEIVDGGTLDTFEYCAVLEYTTVAGVCVQNIYIYFSDDAVDDGSIPTEPVYLDGGQSPTWGSMSSNLAEGAIVSQTVDSTGYASIGAAVLISGFPTYADEAIRVELAVADAQGDYDGQDSFLYVTISSQTTGEWRINQ